MGDWGFLKCCNGCCCTLSANAAFMAVAGLEREEVAIDGRVSAWWLVSNLSDIREALREADGISQRLHRQYYSCD